MEKLKIKKSNFKQEMEYNEWTKHFNFGGGYVEPTKYYNGNPTWTTNNFVVEKPIQKFFRLFSNLLKF